MTKAIATNGQSSPELMEQVIMSGDLAKLTATERLNYYRNVCESLGLNPLTKPFQYIRLNGKLTLYASKDATEQLARIHNVSVTLSEGTMIDDIFIVRAEAQQEFRMVSATGAVFVGNLQGEAKANAFMKAETKASRRAVLRLIGLGWLDESETDSIPGARAVEVDSDTGEIMEQEALPPAKGLDFAVASFKAWLNEQGIKPEELTAVTIPEPTKRNLIAWAKENDISTYASMLVAISLRIQALRDGNPEPEDYIGEPETQYTDEGLPYKPMD